MELGETVRIEMDGRQDAADLRAVYTSDFASLVRLAAALVGSEALGEELVQDTFARILERPPRLISGEKMPAYVRKAVLNASRSKIRRMVLERKQLKAERPVDESNGRPDHELRAALMELPMRQRQCVALRFYDDMTVDQIADVVGVSAGSVKTHLHRGLQQLRNTLGEEGL